MIQLLQLIEPIEDSIKEFYDVRPEKTSIGEKKKYNFDISGNYPFDPHTVSLNKAIDKINNPNSHAKQNRSKSANKTNGNKNVNKNKNSKGNNRKAPLNERQLKLTTIMFPTDSKTNVINEEHAFLKKQMNELKTLYENQILKMEEDRKLREEEYRLQTINWEKQNNELSRNKAKLEHLNYSITKDYMDIKFDNGINEKKLNDEYELIRLQNEALETTLKDLIHKVQLEKEMNKKEYDRKAKNITNTFRNKVKSKEENANIIKEQYKQIQTIYANKVKGLEDQLQGINNKCQLLESRQDIQVDGYLEEITEMRKRLRSYENYARYFKKTAQGSIDRYSDIQRETSKSNDEFLFQTKKTNTELRNLAYRLKQEQKAYNNTKGMNLTNRSENLGNNPNQTDEEDEYENEGQDEEEYMKDDHYADTQNHAQEGYNNNEGYDMNNQNDNENEGEYDERNDNIQEGEEEEYDDKQMDYAS